MLGKAEKIDIAPPPRPKIPPETPAARPSARNSTAINMTASFVTVDCMLTILAKTKRFSTLVKGISLDFSP